MALRRCVTFASRLAALAVALAALGTALVPLPAMAQPKPAKGGAVPPKGKTDMELDPDAKPPPVEDKPLPPAEPGQWGVGGKDEEGKFAPGVEKKKEEEAKKAVDEEKKPADLGPARAVSVDWVVGFGSIGDVTAVTDKTTVTSQSVIFAFSWRFADIWTVGARFPFSQANFHSPGQAYNNTDVKTVAPGNLELYVRPSFEISHRLRVPARLALVFPSAQGDLFGNMGDTVPSSQALVNMAASAARGWEEMPLFSPHRFGIRASGGITYDTESVHLAADTGLDLMIQMGGANFNTNTTPGAVGGLIRNPALAWVTHASFFYGIAAGPGFIEPGLRTWFTYAQAPWYSTTISGSEPQFTLEPAVNARFAVNEDKSMWVKATVGGVLPVIPSQIAGASMKGLRVNAQFGF